MAIYVWFLWWHECHRRKHRHHRHRGHHPHVLLYVNDLVLELSPNKENRLMVKVTVGHGIACTILYRDQNGNPMLTAPTPDQAPAWSNTTPAVETLAPSADGSQCNITTLTPGTDTVNLALNVGGTAFSASLSVEVDAAPQVLTSVEIQATVAS